MHTLNNADRLHDFIGSAFGLEDTVAETKSKPAVEVKFVVNERGNPVGKLADVELHFNEGLFSGLKLIGFAVWERRGGNGLNVTYPARQFSVNGERRSFALLRPALNFDDQQRVTQFILDAWMAFYDANHDNDGQRLQG